MANICYCKLYFLRQFFSSFFFATFVIDGNNITQVETVDSFVQFLTSHMELLRIYTVSKNVPSLTGYYCRLKAYTVFTFLDSFRNKSGKPQPIWTKVGTHAQVKGRQRSRNLGRDRLWGRNGGLKSVPDAGIFCQQYQTTFRQLRNGRFLPNLATTRES